MCQLQLPGYVSWAYAGVESLSPQWEGVCSSYSQQEEPQWLPSPPHRGFWKQKQGSWLAHPDARILQNILEGYKTFHRNLVLNEKDRQDKRKKEKASKLERKERQSSRCRCPVGRARHGVAGNQAPVHLPQPK